MSKILGLSGLSHDASIAYVSGSEILYAAHSERSNKIKNDANFNNSDISYCLGKFGIPDCIAFYENSWQKKTRQLYARQWSEVFTKSNLPKNFIKHNFPELKDIEFKSVSHHLSHAAAGALTSGFNDACVVVCDAIGEWDCLTIWKYHYPNSFEKVYSKKYPNSLGLLYSAFTDLIGLKPNEEEYILMGMAAYGKPKYTKQIINDFFLDKNNPFDISVNTHRGIRGYLASATSFDIAASIQEVIEIKINELMEFARNECPSKNLVYMGGVALNCVANKCLHDHFTNVWIMPNPGDSGSSLGCAGYVGNVPLNWKGPYLGNEINGNYPTNDTMNELLSGNIVGVANGKAEFGPRAFGNRSLLADPRGNLVKDKVNEVKNRQKFRPFAPIVLEEYARKYFEMDGIATSPYMQYVFTCKYPDKFPAIVHADGTSRIQTVNASQHPGLYSLISSFYSETGCPILLNTSLNIKGMPMVDTIEDAAKFEKYYGVKVFTEE